MKHTNVIMKIRPPANQEEVHRAKKDKDNILNELSTKLRMVQSLSQTEGWKFFVAELQDEEQKLLAMMERASDPTTLAKVSGSLLVVKSFQDWPGYMARQLEAQANDLKEEE